MEIYRIEDYKKSRKLVYLDEGAPAFCLYSKEIRQFDIDEGTDISDETYAAIVGLLSKRAKERALYLLDDMPRTEHQLRAKLKDGFYPDEAIDFAISYCKEKHYIDDLDYAIRYIESKSMALSKRMLEQKLYTKGIDKETMLHAFEECEIDETVPIRDFIQKKCSDISAFSYEEKQKVIKKLLAKGFSYDSVVRVINS